MNKMLHFPKLFKQRKGRFNVFRKNDYFTLFRGITAEVSFYYFNNHVVQFLLHAIADSGISPPDSS